jgi:hypothetical protein
MRLIAGGVCALCAARVLQLRLERRRATQLLTSLQERLSLLLHLWGLSTSVLQRAQKANSSSYIDLHSMDRRVNSQLDGASSRPSSPGNAPGNSPPDRDRRSSGELRGARDGACEKAVEGSSSSSWLHRSGVGGSRNNSSGNSIEALASSSGGGGGGLGGGGLGGSLLPSSRSYAPDCA